MSILIKNVEMPTCCDKCFALDDHGDYPYCLITGDWRGYKFRTREKRMDTCPLIEIESVRHGKWFIDANEMLDSLENIKNFDLKFLNDPNYPEKHKEILEEEILWTQKTAEFIMDSPSIEAEPVRHGKWIEEPNCYYRCHECGAHYPSIKGYMDYNYCPNCGAKMDGERKE